MTGFLCLLRGGARSTMANIDPQNNPASLPTPGQVYTDKDNSAAYYLTDGKVFF